MGDPRCTLLTIKTNPHTVEEWVRISIMTPYFDIVFPFVSRP